MEKMFQSPPRSQLNKSDHSSRNDADGVTRGKEWEIMLGIEDPYITAAYLLSLLVAAFCVIYGIKNWNEGMDDI